ncbi:hypothetical protein BCR44DRAFT_1191626 [Catenaria anguillulae PL171]|uniref:Uncharacterized protein n=1 Tax=Catenaria anguillulae PL171 TaxID=765915 RepID=A0A1Y2HIY0_9FUNG|nr:hypothetical protein BCR44DRAFT_1191626 [Catenaria anguillulae PL171]
MSRFPIPLEQLRGLNSSEDLNEVIMEARLQSLTQPPPDSGALSDPSQSLFGSPQTFPPLPTSPHFPDSNATVSPTPDPSPACLRMTTLLPRPWAHAACRFATGHARACHRSDPTTRPCASGWHQMPRCIQTMSRFCRWMTSWQVGRRLSVISSRCWIAKWKRSPSSSMSKCPTTKQQWRKSKNSLPTWKLPVAKEEAGHPARLPLSLTHWPTCSERATAVAM